MEVVKYFLVLEKRLGNYSVIDINKLDICNYHVENTISSIDCFTTRFTDNEIRESIARSNTVQLIFLGCELKIVSDARHNFRVITKDMFSIIHNFQTNTETFDAHFKNKLFGLYKKIIEKIFSDQNFINDMLEKFKQALKDTNKEQVFKMLEEIPYEKSRQLYLCVYDEVMKTKEKVK